MNALDNLINKLDSFVPIQNGEVNKIANENLWLLFLTSAEYEALDKTDLVTFINQAYRLIASKWDNSLVFYAWFDSMAGQLRFSSVPHKYRTNLPFSGKIKLTDNIDHLVDEMFNEYSDMYRDTSICTAKFDDPILVLII
ncbi:MAG: hypothetical protein HRT35_35535 [Algicola sp.]|nr:hypothetical protein [Algicola sp.]